MKSGCQTGKTFDFGKPYSGLSDFGHGFCDTFYGWSVRLLHQALDEAVIKAPATMASSEAKQATSADCTGCRPVSSPSRSKKVFIDVIDRCPA